MIMIIHKGLRLVWLTNTPQYPEASYQVATRSGCYVAPKEDTSI